MRSKAKLDYARRLARVGYNARDIVTLTRLSPTDVIQILREGDEWMSPILPQDARTICMELIENLRPMLWHYPDVLEAVTEIINRRIHDKVQAWNESCHY